MQLSEKKRGFPAKRARFVRTRPLVGDFLLRLAIGFGLWLFLSNPLPANPCVAFSKLKNDSITSSSLRFMAGLLPVFVLMCMVLAIAIVLFCFASFATEKKYIALIQRRTDPAGS
jgi:hypothetical protein